MNREGPAGGGEQSRLQGRKNSGLGLVSQWSLGRSA